MVAAEDALNHAGLNIRKRTSRYSPGTQPNVVLDQIPKAGEVVKEGQTVAVVISRAAIDGESTVAPNTGDNANKKPDADDENKGDEDSSDSESKSKNKNKN